MTIDTNQFMGMTKRLAQNLAESKNLIFRLIRIDNQDFMSYPEDKRDDRVCVEIDNSVITKAVIQ
jgi:hypothetical protein